MKLLQQRRNDKRTDKRNVKSLCITTSLYITAFYYLVGLLQVQLQSSEEIACVMVLKRPEWSIVEQLQRKVHLLFLLITYFLWATGKGKELTLSGYISWDCQSIAWGPPRSHRQPLGAYQRTSMPGNIWARALLDLDVLYKAAPSFQWSPCDCQQPNEDLDKRIMMEKLLTATSK